MSDLALTWLDFVSTKVLLGFNVECVSTSDRIVFLQRKLFSSVLNVLSSVIRTVSAEFADKSY